MRDDNRELVYSSESGFVRAPKASVRKPAKQSQALPNDGIIRVARERRRGGIVSMVTGLADSELSEVGKELKKHCGTGGTAKNGVVEIQGDHREKIVAWFVAKGRRAKVAGG
ncbi:MAG: stress response translation initiation inhibitor YciH [Vulcanimicrobiaceae bacterium]